MQNIGRGVTRLRGAVAGVRQKKGLNWVLSVLAMLVLPLIYLIFIEFVRGRSVTGVLQYTFNHLGRMALGGVVVAAVMAFFTFASARVWVANLVCGTLLFFMAYGNYYKLVYRGDPLVPKDLVQLGEAARISGEIAVPPTRELWLFIAFLLLSTLLLVPLRLPFTKGWKSLVARLATCAVCAAFVPLFTFGYFGNKDMMRNRHGVYARASSLAETYYVGSFFTSFLYLTASLWQAPPQEYSAQTMHGLAGQLPQTGTRTPDIVVVLLESFYDITDVEGVTYSQPLLQNYNRLAQQGTSGTLLVDKRGGGTSDYEFSVLTGFSTSLLPVGSVPYVEYIYDDFPSLPYYCKQNEYSTLAVHPYESSFYNRSVAYAQMGFDEFLTVKDFSEEDKVGTYVGDAPLANRVIEEYEQRAAAGPVMMHVVTMQNHIPYSPGVYPPGYAVEVEAPGKSEEYIQSLSTLATGIRDEDAMIGALCDYFSKVDRDVILLFFGDHQSSIEENEQQVALAEGNPAYQNASGAAQYAMTHTTPYLIWANYTQKQTSGGLVAPYMLVPLLQQHGDVKGPAWFGWLAGTKEALPGEIGGWYINPDGTITQQPTAGQLAVQKNHNLFQYDILFGGQYARRAMYGEESTG